MSEPSSTHPAARPDVVAMREGEPVVRNVDWHSDEIYKLWFDRRATEDDIEHFLDTVKTKYRFIPTDEQDRGRNVLVERAPVPIETTDCEAGESNE